MASDVRPAIRLFNHISGAAFRRVPNPTLQWHGVEQPGPEAKLLLRIGDCSWQAIEHGHTWGEPGYPSLVADALLAEGTELRFANFHAEDAAALPAGESIDHILAGETPDAIVLEIGAAYAGRGLIKGVRIRPFELRTWVHWVTGRWGGAVHRHISRPLLRRWGNHRSGSASELAAGESLRSYLAFLGERYPGVPVAFLPPHMTDIDGAIDPDRLSDAASVLRAAALRSGGPVTIIEIGRGLEQAAGRGEIFAANGHDLRRDGHEVVAGGVLEWLRSSWKVS